MQNILDTFPDVMRIETSGKCNFRCIHCPTGTQPNTRPVLSKERFDYIVSQFKGNKFIPRVIVLYHGGEPLLNKNLSHYIRKFKKLGVIKTVITTNASLLNEELSKKLILAGLDEMKISFDGQSPEENNHIRQNGNFHTDAAKIKTFCKVRKTLRRNNPNIIISNVQICDKTTLQTLYLNGKSTFQDAPAYLTKYFSDEYDKIDFKSYPAMIWPGYKKFGGLEAISFPTDKPKYCGSLFETYTILSNGCVVPCCYDLKEELVLGNIYEENIFSIWKNEKYTRLRSNFRRQQYHEFCRKCKLVSPRYLCKTLPVNQKNQLSQKAAKLI